MAMPSVFTELSQRQKGPLMCQMEEFAEFAGAWKAADQIRSKMSNLFSVRRRNFRAKYVTNYNIT